MNPIEFFFSKISKNKHILKKNVFQAVDVDLKKYANVSKWLAESKSTFVGYEEVNQKGIDGFKIMVANLTKK